MPLELTAEDIKQGLNDETDEIRVTTAFWIFAAMDEWNGEPRPDAQGGLAAGSRPAQEQAYARYALLATVFLDHLNDNHPYVRQAAAFGFHSIFRQRIDRGEGKYSFMDSVDLPPKFDWVRSDWQTRCATQETWRQWWVEHGAASLRRAYPPVAANTFQSAQTP
jgi:hypothetical protein